MREFLLRTTDGTGQRTTGTRGVLRGPRGPKKEKPVEKVSNDSRGEPWVKVHSNSDDDHDQHDDNDNNDHYDHHDKNSQHDDDGDKGEGECQVQSRKNDDDNHKMLHYNIFFSIGFPNMNMVSLYIVCTGNVNISLHLSNRVSPPTP